MNSIDVSNFINQSPIGRFQIKVTILCALVSLLDGFDVQAMALVTPSVAMDWNLPVSSFGPVLSSSFAGLLLGAMIGGVLGDRYGRRLILIGAFLAVGVTSILTALVENTSQMMICRVLTGFGIGACMPNFTALTVEYIPERRQAFFVTLVFSAIPLGGVIGGYIAGDIIDWLSWRAVFLLGGAFPVVIGIILLFSVPESIRFLVNKGTSDEIVGATLQKINATYEYQPGDHYIIERKTKSSSVPALFTEGRAGLTVALWAIFFFSLFSLYLLTSWLPSVFSELGWPMNRALQTISYFFIGGIFGGLVVGWFIDQYGPYPVLTTTFIVGALLTAAIGSGSWSIGQALIVITFAGFAVVGGQTGTTALAATIYPTLIRSTGVGWGLGVGRLGAVISPTLGGLALAAQWSQPELFAGAASPAIVCAAMVIVIWFLQRKTGQ